MDTYSVHAPGFQEAPFQPRRDLGLVWGGPRSLPSNGELLCYGLSVAYE